MSLPQPNPARPSALEPFFQDANFVRGDRSRDNNTAIWQNFTYLDVAAKTPKETIALSDRVMFTKADADDEPNTITVENALVYFFLIYAYLLDFAASNFTIRESASGVTYSLGIAYGNSVFVAVCSGTKDVQRSVNNGQTWSGITNVNVSGMTGLAFGNSVFVAVGSTDAARSTDNGLTWTRFTNLPGGSVNNQWSDVAFGNGVFIAISNNTVFADDVIMRSTDNGLTWAAVSSPIGTNPLYGIAYGGGVFVIVSPSGTNRVLRSVDNGQTWSAVAAAEANTWAGVAYGNGVFVAAARSGTNRIMRSTNGGQTWSAVAAAAQSEWESVAYGNGNFVVVSNNASDGVRIMRSSDGGLSWSVVASPNAYKWYKMIFGGNIFAATGNKSDLSAGNIITSLIGDV